MMKKYLFLLPLFISVVLPAQELSDAQKAALEAAQAISGVKEAEPVPEKPNYWTNSYDFTVGFNQTFLTNWAAGGYNTVTLAAGVDVKADYAKNLTSWSNRLQLDYGFLWSADKMNLLQKSKDRIYLESKFAYKTAGASKWNYTASLNFRSQFSNSFDNYQQDDPQDPKSRWHGDLKSGFLSPAYTDIALGVEWKPSAWFDMNIAPLTGGITAVTDEFLRGSYGMKLKKEYEGVEKPEGYMYNSFLFQFGAQIKMNARVNINDSFKYETQLVLFTDYLDKPFVHNRVNWDNAISWTPAKFFKIALSTWLIYDPLVTIVDVRDNQPKTSLLQFKEFFSINFAYTIAPKKKG